MISNTITWHDHVHSICSKSSKRIYFLILLKRAGKSPSDIVDTYTSIIRSVLEYVCIVWHPGLTQHQSDQIEHIQKRCLSIAHPSLGYKEALLECGLDTLSDRREAMCQNFFKSIQDENHKLHYLLPPPRDHVHLRNFRMYEPPKVRTDRLKNSPINYGLFNFQKNNVIC